MMRTLAIRMERYAALLMVLLLGACSGNDEMLSLQQYVQGVENRAPGVIDPLPEFVSYEAFTYSAASLRSPFDAPVDISTLASNQNSRQVRPDENRRRENLENFSLGALAMVGTMAKAGRTWALIRDETGSLSRITVGNYLGRNHGRVLAISKTQLELREIVPTGDGGWIERPQTIFLQQ